jgi:RNA polymerase sigma-70 factor, ECF subfamily
MCRARCGRSIAFVPTAQLPHIPTGTRVLDPAGLGDHLDRLYRAALALCGSRERADDLVQDTYARVLARPRFLRNDDDLGYLLRVLRNTFISQRRRARSRPELPATDTLDWLEDPKTPQPQDVAETHLVYDAIAALSPNFRDALVAVDVAGLSYREAARALRIGEATLTTRLFRARKRVAGALEPQRPIDGRLSAMRPAAALRGDRALCSETTR